MPAERLQKIIAAAGIASRRKAEELITAGRVEVNGKTVKELGSKADPQHDHIRVDGKLLHGPQRPVYLMLNKPKGYITAASDPEGRPTVLDLVRAGARIYPVGRLDYASEGLLLLTNDGALAAKLMHASSHVPKTYQVKVSGRPTEADLGKLRAGVVLPPDPKHPRAARKGSRKTAPAGIRMLRDAPNPWYEVTLIEGQNRQIRRMFETVGHHVEKIKRVRYGPLELDLEPGAFRPLTPRELSRLRAAVSEKRGGLEARRRDTKDIRR
jgi:23S rRNA pseudouridine2605 synthase